MKTFSVNSLKKVFSSNKVNKTELANKMKSIDPNNLEEVRKIKLEIGKFFIQK